MAVAVVAVEVGREALCGSTVFFWGGMNTNILGPPVVPFSTFVGWEGSHTKIDYGKKKWYPYSNLAKSGGPSKCTKMAPWSMEPQTKTRGLP